LGKWWLTFSTGDDENIIKTDNQTGVIQMNNLKLITLDEMAALLNCNRERVENWLESKGESLIRRQDGKCGVDPVQLCEFLNTSQ